MNLPIIGVIFCIFWVCISTQEVSQTNLHPRAPKTHFESRNSLKSPQKIVKNTAERPLHHTNSFRPSQDENEEELRKYASHFTSRKAASLRHDDPVVSKNFIS
jgi:hypothetical protein